MNTVKENSDIQDENSMSTMKNGTDSGVACNPSSSLIPDINNSGSKSVTEKHANNAGDSLDEPKTPETEEDTNESWEKETVLAPEDCPPLPPVISVRKSEDLFADVQRIPAKSNSQSPYRPSTTPPKQHYINIPQTVGSDVVLSPVSPSPSIPNLPPGIQLAKRSTPVSTEQPAPKQRREEKTQPSHIRLPDSITLVSRTPAQQTPQQRQLENVTGMLANRGITVVPSGRSQPAASSPPVLTRHLNSAISITSLQHRAGPISPAHKAVLPTKVPTVDLTKESDRPRRSLKRGISMHGPTGRSVCQICDKAFSTSSELSQHMVCHRRRGLSYECSECTAQYPTEESLQAHKQKYHGAGGPSPDLAIPIVDLKQVGVLSKLAALGIKSVIPLAQLHSGSGGGMFALPVVAMDSASNPAICNIGELGTSNLLPLGPLKKVPFNKN